MNVFNSKIFQGKGQPHPEKYWVLPFTEHCEYVRINALESGKKVPNEKWTAFKYVVFEMSIPLCLHNFVYNTKEKVNHFLCKRYGHKYDVTANMGPESGAEDFCCTRCGATHNIVYY